MKKFEAKDVLIFVVLGVLIAPIFILTNPHLPDVDPRQGSILTVILLAAGIGGGALVVWQPDYAKIGRNVAIVRSLGIGLCIGTLLSGWMISTDPPATFGYIAFMFATIYKIMDSLYGQKMRVATKK